MSGFENFSREAADLERELERKGIILGIDWNELERSQRAGRVVWRVSNAQR